MLAISIAMLSYQNKLVNITNTSLPNYITTGRKFGRKNYLRRYVPTPAAL